MLDLETRGAPYCFSPLIFGLGLRNHAFSFFKDIFKPHIFSIPLDFLVFKITIQKLNNCPSIISVVLLSFFDNNSYFILVDSLSPASKHTSTKSLVLWHFVAFLEITQCINSGMRADCQIQRSLSAQTRTSRPVYSRRLPKHSTSWTSNWSTIHTLPTIFLKMSDSSATFSSPNRWS